MVGGLSYWFNPYDELSLLGISIYKLMGAHFGFFKFDFNTE
jgi:hypothetical protein